MSSGDTSVKKPGHPLRVALGLFADYSLNTTVHGLRYIFEERRHWTERLWWTIAFVESLIVCIWQLVNLHHKWVTSPVIVSFAEQSTPIWDIPFPAMTICAETKSRRNLLNYGDIFDKMSRSKFDPPIDLVSADELRKFQALQEVCSPKGPSNTHNGTIDGDVGDLLREIHLNETFGGARYQNQWISDVSQIVTQEGVCYTFNMVRPNKFYQEGVVNEIREGPDDDSDHSLWDPDTRYNDSPDQTADDYFAAYPRRSFQAGARGGLVAVLLHSKHDLDFLCGSAFSGFRFILHPPDEFPQVHQFYNRVPLDKALMVGIIPKVQSTSDNLRGYTPQERQCFFNYERRLRYFRVYTQRNCELECLTDFTLKKCGCVRLGMPRFNTTITCDTSHRSCYEAADEDLLKRSLIESRQEDQYCNCLPSCLTITYNAEISQSDLKLKEFIAESEKYEPDNKQLKEYFTSTMTIFFKEKQFTESRRAELYGPTDFLANFGGSLGLFMGISLLSVVEVIYFCTLRLFLNVRRKPAAGRVAIADESIVTQTKL